MTCAGQNPFSHSRMPMDVTIHGRSMSLFMASQPKAIGAQQDNAAPPDMLLRRRGMCDHRLKPGSVISGDREEYSCAHPAESHRTEQMGIPNRTPLLRSIH